MAGADPNATSGSSYLGAGLLALTLWISGSIVVALALALGWIPSPPQSLLAPRWIIAVAGPGNSPAACP